MTIGMLTMARLPAALPRELPLPMWRFPGSLHERAMLLAALGRFHADSLMN